MQTYIVLLRGINVGGNNKVVMKELQKQLKNAGYEGVKTYIQSGNIILESDNLEERDISAIFGEYYEFIPDVLVFTRGEFLLCSQQNPFCDYPGNTVHFYFCKSKVELNQDKINAVKASDERIVVKDKMLYLHAPSGLAKSKFIKVVDACVGTTATGRNLNIVNKLLELSNNG
ncbi:MAG: DUF1697 domain-containing protein [Alteromonadaceae bacterium]|nr:DUF1697 domain-containing protein [Alteromonadaceae bacterium]